MEKILIFCFSLFLPMLLNAQSSFTDNFNDGIVSGNWDITDRYRLSESGGICRMEIDKTLWDGIAYSFPVMDIGSSPYVSLDIKTSEDCSMMIWIYDAEGMRIPVSHFIPASDTFRNFCFDFTGMYENYRWDGRFLGNVDYSRITTILFNLNPGGDLNCSMQIDNLAIGDGAEKPAITPGTGPYLEKVEIRIDEDSIAKLDLDPTSDEDVYGDFIDNENHFYPYIQLHYRGASNLMGLIQSDRVQRNWKVKVDKDNMYKNRREWNFNFSTHGRQDFAYKLFEKANVPCIRTRLVNMFVNGERHGLYLEYEDPDNKPWLLETFGNDEGDLFKAATDVPGYPSYFAELRYLGPKSSDYFEHYRKKTNHKVAPEDYTSIRDFIVMLNYTPNDQFIDSLENYFDTEAFIKYLVVSNFISNWDGYPHRGKNFWMYENPASKKWSFIPWDLDLTCELMVHSWNQMGPRADIFYQFDEHIWAGRNYAEHENKALVRRMMKFAEYRNAYIGEYKNSLSGILQKESLFDIIDSIGNEVRMNSENYEYQIFNNSLNEIKVFVHQKLQHLEGIFDTLQYVDTTEVTDYVPDYPDLNLGQENKALESTHPIGLPYPNPCTNEINIDLNLTGESIRQLEIFNQYGQRVYICPNPAGLNHSTWKMNVSQFEKGLYLIRIYTGNGCYSRKFMKTP